MHNKIATQSSWERNFEGDVHLHILKAISERTRAVTPHGNYANFATIVQSSGMGKSRMVDEMGKHVLLIPVNLRPDGDTGGLSLLAEPILEY